MYVLGVDGGGTGCRAALATSSGEIIGRGNGGPANIRTDLDAARRNIIAAAEQACAEAGIESGVLSSAGAVLGLAGANVGDYARQLEALLPFANTMVVSDALIALEGAVGDSGDGAIAILGTGTAYLSRKAGEPRAIGGWGFQVGDQGSGARIGRQLLEDVLLAHDGVGATSPLTDDVLASFGNDPQAVVSFALEARPGDFGKYTPKVLDYDAKGDIVAAAIMRDATASVEASINAMHLEDGVPLSLLGGLAPFYAKRLSPELAARVRPPRQDALGGAVLMATRIFAERDN